jgi:hypothetical protein
MHGNASQLVVLRLLLHTQQLDGEAPKHFPDDRASCRTLRCYASCFGYLQRGRACEFCVLRAGVLHTLYSALECAPQNVPILGG